MTGRIAGFVTRAEAGLRRPRSVSRNITPAQGGVAVHYGGPAQKLGDHAACVRRWAQWQRFHVDSRGWSDIAYTGGYCDHGYAFAGRGAGVRTAANGTNAGNDDYYAVTWLGGEGEVPTTAALDALEWWVAELRKAGAGKRVRAHRSFKPTGCPGDHLVRVAADLDGQPVETTPTPTPAPAPAKPAPASPRPALAAPKVPPYPGLTVEGMRNSRVTARFQQRLKDRGWKITVDGDHGPGTSRVLRAFQQEKRLQVDGKGGPATWKALWAAPVTR